MSTRVVVARAALLSIGFVAKKKSKTWHPGTARMIPAAPSGVFAPNSAAPEFIAYLKEKMFPFVFANLVSGVEQLGTVAMNLDPAGLKETDGAALAPKAHC